jgi:UDP-N-acetylmuramoylalanine--D-glutamate ligase
MTISRKSPLLEKLSGRNIGILGLGIENFALVKFLLSKKVDCHITICDERNSKKLGERYEVLRRRKQISWKIGPKANRDLHGFDLLFRSPGWPLFDHSLIEAWEEGVHVSSAMRLFFDLCPTKNIIGVTGTKGKGTTASLIYHILKSARRRVWLGGNIGIAPFDFINKIKKDDFVVLELSSFQLEDMEESPYIGVITNFFPEHQSSGDPNNPNFHRSLASYWRAKSNIIKWQKADGKAVVNKKLSAKLKQDKYKGKTFFYEKMENVSTQLPGEHNKENIAAAVKAAKLAGVNETSIFKAVSTFKGLPHRLKLVKKIGGKSYYDDSFATTPESAITALRSVSDPIVLLAGGAEKDSDFSELANMIVKKVKFLVLFKGDATPRLKDAVINAGFKASNIRTARDMEEAVSVAKEFSEKGDSILLSPACASFGMFKNYKERGDLFIKEVGKT